MTVPRKFPHESEFQQTLTENLSSDQASVIIQHARMQHQALFKNRKKYSKKALQKHLEGFILPGIALHQSLLANGYPREEALVIMEMCFRELSKPMRKRMVLLGRLPFFYPLLRIMAKPIMKANFPAEGWKIEWKEFNQESIAFDMKSCFYLDVLTEYDLPELTSLYCWMDDLIYDEVSPYIKWDRTKTLGRGDDCCNFRFVRSGPDRE
jgi:hypothetical protein